jgi:hypothetical protein
VDELEMEDQREGEEWELIEQLKEEDCRDRYLWSTRIEKLRKLENPKREKSNLREMVNGCSYNNRSALVFVI